MTRAGRRTGMRSGRRRVRWSAPLIVASLLLVACGRMGLGGPGRTEPIAAPTSPGQVGPAKEPPPVTVRSSGRVLELSAYTYCYGSVCADGVPPAEPPEVGNPEEVMVEFPLPGWSFTASFRRAGEECGRIQESALEPAGEGAWFLRPVGYAGTYDVTLFGRGNGDLFVTFRWTTPRDGPLPEPEARLAVLADHDGQVDSYGIELEVRNLARTPREAAATITVRAANGKAITFEAAPSRQRCLPVGTVYWDGPDKQGREAASLGGGPFVYEVELVLDGRRYTGTASWPADEIHGNEPSVALRFRPGLPSLEPR
jgi:hypothetical protein